MLVRPVWNSGAPNAGRRVDIVVVAPRIGVQGAVAHAPDRGTGELVGSRASGDLSLPIAPAQFGIDGCQNEAYFSNHVRVDHGGGEDSVLATTVADAQAVANRVD